MADHSPKRATTAREFFSGVGFLLRGFRMWISAPKLMLLGLIPAAIVGTAAIAVLVAVILNIDTISASITPFAQEWGELAQTATEFAAGLAVIVASILLIVNTYTTVTLMVGDAFYRLISSHVDSVNGAPPQAQSQGFWRDLARGIAEGLRVFLPTVALAVLVLLLGFIPVVGGVIAATAGAFLGGWLLVVELSNIPFEARGLHLTARRRVLRGFRARSLGLGAATYLVFLIPFGAVLAMPAALAGATLLTRSVLGEDPRLSALPPEAEATEQPPNER